MNLIIEVSFSHVKHVKEQGRRKTVDYSSTFLLKNQQYITMTHEISSKWWNPSHFKSAQILWFQPVPMWTPELSFFQWPSGEIRDCWPKWSTSTGTLRFLVGYVLPFTGVPVMFTVADEQLEYGKIKLSCLTRVQDIPFFICCWVALIHT